MLVYTYMSALLVLCISYIYYSKYVNLHNCFVVKPEKRYDYIIVGAGTAGCVLASRLSEDPTVRVLLIEAGDHMSYFTRIPLTATAAQLGPNDWSFKTVPQKYSSFGLWDQSQIIPRGKGLGGSGQINFMMHSFGLSEDYDRWSRMGFKGWTLKDLKPYFIKAFGTVRNEFDSTHCTIDGYCPGDTAPMKLKIVDENDELMQTFMKSTEELKLQNMTFKKATASIKDGMRFSTFDAYLKPALQRNNLHVLLKTRAISIHFEKKSATSIYILQNNRDLDNIFANREIILSAGAINTPQLLILSGVGPSSLIRRLRINLVSDNDQVGRNLHDHLNMPIYVTIKKPISITLSKVFTVSTVWNYFWNKQGLLSFPPVAGVEHDHESALILFSMGTASERLLKDLSNYKPQIFRSTYPFYNHTTIEGFMFLATCLQPKSRGYVTLKDSSTSIPPVVDPNYLHRYWDVKCIRKAIRRAEGLISSNAFQNIGAKIHWPRAERCLSLWNYTKEDQVGITKRRKRKSKTPGIQQSSKQSGLPKNSSLKIKSPPNEYLDCVIREVAVTGHHVGGTAAGGAVVDHLLRVKSVSGVRVVDASVLPSPVSPHPNSVLVALAERAADIIRNYTTNI